MGHGALGVSVQVAASCVEPARANKPAPNPSEGRARRGLPKKVGPLPLSCPLLSTFKRIGTNRNAYKGIILHNVGKIMPNYCFVCLYMHSYAKLCVRMTVYAKLGKRGQ